MSTNLQCIRDKARMEKKLQFSNLLHHITVPLLLESLKKTSRSSAAGCDGMRKEEAIESFPTWSSEVLKSLHQRSYQAPPVRRVWIPKPGKVEKRPIGVPTVLDRTVQRSVSRVLESIYEEDFLNVSFGGRPQLSAHHAVCTLQHQIQTQKVNWVLECDIKNFFGSIDHGWVMRFVEHRVADPRILSLIKKWLKAGVLENETLYESEVGTPQGGSISVLLSNIYLHYVLDLWFEKQRKKVCRGQAYLVRYLDDFVICFQLKSDAQAVQRDLADRLGKFGLQLEPEKTKLLNFGRFSSPAVGSIQKKPATFSFLGFTFCAGKSGQGKFLVRLKTERKRINRFLQKVRTQLQLVRHNAIQDQVKDINLLLRGHFRYFGMGGNIEALNRVHRQTVKFWRSVLNTRSQKAKLTWAKMNKILGYSKLEPPRLSLPYKLMPEMVRL
jgi:RNA-directed DNA polymerase